MGVMLVCFGFGLGLKFQFVSGFGLGLEGFPGGLGVHAVITVDDKFISKDLILR